MDRIDEILYDWWAWQASYVPALGYGRADLASRDFRISRQWMDYDDLNEEVERNLQAAVGKIVEPMVQKLSLRERVALNVAMHNFATGALVWSSVRLENFDAESEYQRVKAILRPQLIAASLLEKSECLDFQHEIV